MGINSGTFVCPRLPHSIMLEDQVCIIEIEFFVCVRKINANLSCLVMKAVAAIGALHSAVAGKKVTAHAECEAVRLVGAQKLAGTHRRNLH